MYLNKVIQSLICNDVYNKLYRKTPYGDSRFSTILVIILGLCIIFSDIMTRVFLDCETPIKIY